MKWIRMQDSNVLQKNIDAKTSENAKFIYNVWKIVAKYRNEEILKRFRIINSLLSIYHVRWLKKNFRINYSIDLIINLYFI